QSLAAFAQPCDTLRSICGFWLKSPFLVVIMMTPFAPLDPYNAVASASLSTSMLAMSAGLMSAIGDVDFPPVLTVCRLFEFTKTPSTIKSGLFPDDMEVAPRNRILIDSPGTPVLLEIWTPGIF